MKRILLSNDDGNDSIGSRLLVELLKDKYKIVVAGPRNQQSSVGAGITLNGFKWGVDDEEKVKKYWVDGTPVDAIELIYTQVKEPFDLVISGLNLGPNISTGIYRSGTYNAVTCSLGLGLAEKGIAISWDAAPKYWDAESEKIKMDDFLSCPGRMMKYILKKGLKNELWGSEIVNINLPRKCTEKYRFTKLAPKHYHAYDKDNNVKKGVFRYRNSLAKNSLTEEYDVKTLRDGFISITPCRHDLTDHKVFCSF